MDNFFNIDNITKITWKSIPRITSDYISCEYIIECGDKKYDYYIDYFHGVPIHAEVVEILFYSLGYKPVKQSYILTNTDIDEMDVCIGKHGKSIIRYLEINKII